MIVEPLIDWPLTKVEQVECMQMRSHEAHVTGVMALTHC